MGLLARAAAIYVLFCYHFVAAVSVWGWQSLRKIPLLEKQQRLGRRLAALCRRLGATFIKAAQVLATRADIIPDGIRDSLTELHDKVGAFPYPQARDAIIQELGAEPEQLFLQFDPYPVASASVAQVHRAILQDGREVAVKVLRPQVEQLVASDLQILRIWARILAILPPIRRFSPEAIAAEFATALSRQLDLSAEADNSRRFREVFVPGGTVGFPEVVPHLSGRRVLTMEYIDGEGIMDRAQRDPQARNALARAGYRMVLEMVFEHGFVHADLHPGNMRIRGDTLFLFDLGLVAEVAPEQRKSLRSICLAWVGRDVSTICTELSAIAFSGEPPEDAQQLRRDVEDLMTRYSDIALGKIQVGRLLFDLLRLVRHQWVRIDPTLTMVAVSIAVVEGVARQLAPDLRLMQEAIPFMTELIRREAAAS